MTYEQQHLLNTHPDVIWQYAQYLKKEEVKKGNKIQIFAISRKSINNRPRQEFIDPNVDLTKIEWDYFKHAPWIREFKEW